MLCYASIALCTSNGEISARAICHLSRFIMSHSLLWGQIVLLTVGVYSSNHRVLLCLTVYCGDIVLLTVGVYSSNHRELYTIGISMTRRFQKSIGPSVCQFVTLTNKAYPSVIIDSRKIFFKYFTANFRKIWHLHKMPTPPSL